MGGEFSYQPNWDPQTVLTTTAKRGTQRATLPGMETRTPSCGSPICLRALTHTSKPWARHAPSLRHLGPARPQRPGPLQEQQLPAAQAPRGPEAQARGGAERHGAQEAAGMALLAEGS